MSRAFTLIELLVVITIIVVLLALLTPALDKAIYQAELAVCGTQLNATAKGVTVYAMDFKRTYPYRELVAGGNASRVYPWQLNIGAQAAGAQPPGLDIRPLLKGYMDLALLVDPLCERVRLDDPDAWAYTSYALWSGWIYKGEQGMTRLGNRLTWTDASAAPSKTHSVNWLITDLDSPSPGFPCNQGSHPDRDGMLRNSFTESGGKDDPSPLVQANNQLGKESSSMWVRWNDGWDRGEIDMNAAAADGAVTRYSEVDTCDDERMGRAPVSPDGVIDSTARTRQDGSGRTVPSAWINVPIH